jgi:hypothetical protein
VRIKILLVALLVATTCLAQEHKSNFLIDPSKPYVYLKFDHIGKRAPMYAGEGQQGLWLRLVNNCRIPVEVATYQDIAGNPGVPVPDEIIKNSAIRGPKPADAGQQNRDGDVPPSELPDGYPSDVPETVLVEPGTSIVFGVPLNHVSPRWHLQVQVALHFSTVRRVSQPQTGVAFFWTDIPEKFRTAYEMAQANPGSADMEKMKVTIEKIRSGETLTARADAAKKLADQVRYLSDQQITESLVTDITSLLDLPDDAVRFYVAMALANIGPGAKSAVPKLEELLPAAECLDGVITSAGGIWWALIRMHVKIPESPKCDSIPRAA